MPYLLYVNQKGENKVAHFLRNISIGRSDKNDILLNSEYVSRYHAKIYQDIDELYYLVDLGSSNGTIVESEAKHIKKNKYKIYDNLTFQIDQFSFIFIDESSDSENEIADHKVEQTIMNVNHTKHKSKYLDNIVLVNEKMIKLYHTVKEIAPSDFAAIILGESGTGKELIARLFHDYSNRKGKFFELNCANFKDDIFESEMFGSKKGAYSGALDKNGILLDAINGTIFLDEIGDIEPKIQAKLLRFLDYGTFYQVGSSKLQTSNARIISATNLDLEEMVKQKVFRSELYHRLTKITVTVPPLRERQDEIIPMAKYFLEEYSKQFPWKRPVLTKSAESELLAYHWPGNIRELGNKISNAMVLVRGKPIHNHHIMRCINNNKTPATSSICEMERNEIIHVLNIYNGNKTKAAKHLKFSRGKLYRKMKEYAIT